MKIQSPAMRYILEDPKHKQKAAKEVERLTEVLRGYEEEERLPRILQMVEQYNQKGKIKNKITCSAGCFACCQVPVGATDLEVDFALQAAKKKNVDINLEALKMQINNIKNIEFWNDETNPFKDCVFLKEKKCSIYEERPLACRLHLVSSDPKQCNHDTKKVIILSSEILVTALMNVQKAGHFSALLFNKLTRPAQ
jgi:Fe-S-cluster containining protein